MKAQFVSENMQKPFANDEERLEYLFKMYEEMAGKEGK